MEKRLFSEDKESGITRTWHYNPLTDEATIQTSQDVTGIIEENKQEFNQVDEKANWNGEWHKVASIPMSIYAQLKAEGKLEDTAYMKRWLNDPDNKYFRVRPGQV
jgi:hypothetical protein